MNILEYGLLSFIREGTDGDPPVQVVRVDTPAIRNNKRLACAYYGPYTPIAACRNTGA